MNRFLKILILLLLFLASSLAPVSAQSPYNSVAAWGGTSSGTANAQTITIPNMGTRLTAGQIFNYIAGNTNTGAETLAVNSGTAHPIIWNGTALSGGESISGAVQNILWDGSNFQLLGFNPQIGRFERGYISGFQHNAAGASASFTVAAGQATDSTSVSVMKLSSTFTKTTSAWSAGSSGGCLDTGSIANNTSYATYAIFDPATGVTDIECSASMASPALPSGYTLYRQIGILETDGSAHWIQVSQVGDVFYLGTPISNNYSVSTSAALFASGCPTASVTAKLRLAAGLALTPSLWLFSSPAEGIHNANTISGNVTIPYLGTGAASDATVDILTNSSGQIYIATTVSDTTYVVCYAYVMSRGKN